MNMSSILIASASIGGMGLLFGSALAFASQKFAVETDPRTLEILEVLPGANCGGCGFPGLRRIKLVPSFQGCPGECMPRRGTGLCGEGSGNHGHRGGNGPPEGGACALQGRL